MRKGKIRELVDKVYELTKYEPVPIKSISKHGDSIDKVQRYLQRRGILLKTGSKKHERIQWNPDAMAPTTTLYDNIYKDHENYLARKRDRRSKPSPKPSSQPQAKEPSQKYGHGAIYRGNKVITHGGEFFELDDIYAIANGRALGVHHSKQCGDFFSVKLEPAETAFLVGIIQDRLENEL